MFGCSSIKRIAPTLARTASARAVAPPISPAPRIATSDIARSFYMWIAKCRVRQKFIVRQALEKRNEVFGFRRRYRKPLKQVRRDAIVAARVASKRAHAPARRVVLHHLGE